MVAPLVGAWIEILIRQHQPLKLHVAPLVGAWIEIIYKCSCHKCCACVAPLVGAWIEIIVYTGGAEVVEVAPLVGAWIEMTGTGTSVFIENSRSPCGSVD